MDFAALDRDVASTAFDLLGCGVTVTRAGVPTSVRAIVEDGVEQIGEYGRVIGRATRISFLKSEWEPVRGDLVTVDNSIRPIESLDTDDGIVVQAVLHG